MDDHDLTGALGLLRRGLSSIFQAALVDDALQRDDGLVDDRVVRDLEQVGQLVYDLRHNSLIRWRPTVERDLSQAIDSFDLDGCVLGSRLEEQLVKELLAIGHSLQLGKDVKLHELDLLWLICLVLQQLYQCRPLSPL